MTYELYELYIHRFAYDLVKQTFSAYGCLLKALMCYRYKFKFEK